MSVRKSRAVHKSTLYREGDGWVVSTWNVFFRRYDIVGPMPYLVARNRCAKENGLVVDI